MNKENRIRIDHKRTCQNISNLLLRNQSSRSKIMRICDGEYDSLYSHAPCIIPLEENKFVLCQHVCYINIFPVNLPCSTDFVEQARSNAGLPV